jgi:hypothetical protein
MHCSGPGASSRWSFQVVFIDEPAVTHGSSAILAAVLHRHLYQSELRQALLSQTPITAANLLNDRVLPFFEEHTVKLLRVLTDRGSEFWNPERREYELYLAVEIHHSRTKAKSPQMPPHCCSRSSTSPESPVQGRES